MAEWWEPVLTVILSAISWYVGWRAAVNVMEKRFEAERKARRQDDLDAARQRAYAGPYERIKMCLNRALYGSHDWFHSRWHPDDDLVRPLYGGGLDDPWHAPLKGDVERVLSLHEKAEGARRAYTVKFKDAYLGIVGASMLGTSEGDKPLSVSSFTDTAFEGEVHRGDRATWCERHYQTLVSNLGGPGRLSYKDPEVGAKAVIGAAFDSLAAEMRPLDEAHKAAVADLVQQAKTVCQGLTRAKEQETFYPGKP